MKEITVSIVSHGHGDLLTGLLADLKLYAESVGGVIITLNIPENVGLNEMEFPFKVDIISNESPKGFGTNHNYAFSLCTTEFFCVCNPDIRLSHDPFVSMLSCHENKDIALTAPLVISARGELEDSARYFPTPWSILKKVLWGFDGRFLYQKKDKLVNPDWVGGMLMLFKTESYGKLSGFDESYFLYYEDVDICARIWKSGLKVALCLDSSVIHNARRSSRRDLQYMKWHLISMIKFFFKHLSSYPLRG